MGKSKAFRTSNIGEAFDRKPMDGISIFDPVLTEIVLRWFSPIAADVLDPFAGGSVRGVVAAKLGRRYVGLELRKEQVDANRDQWAELGPKDIGLPNGMTGAAIEQIDPQWVVGDSLKLLPKRKAQSADLVFTCPPYHDLEQYSGDPADLSAMEWDDFLAAYRKIIAASCRVLRQDRFAVIVVGDLRGPDGCYRNFPGETVRAFLDAGLRLYNDCVLFTRLVNLPLTAKKNFKQTRKLAKAHQNVFVFVKGDPLAAAEFCGDVEVADVPNEEGGGDGVSEADASTDA